MRLVLGVGIFLCLVGGAGYVAAQSGAKPDKKSPGDEEGVSSKQSTEDAKSVDEVPIPGLRDSVERGDRPTLSDLAEAHTSETERPMCACPDEAEQLVLMSLQKRRQELEEREKLLIQREEALSALERDLNVRMEALVTRLASVEGRLGINSRSWEVRQRKLLRLIRTFDELSTRKAAPLLEGGERALAVVVLERLGPKKAGEILAKMKPSTAAQLLKAMTPWRVKELAQAAAGGGG